MSLSGDEVGEIKMFKYLGSVLQNDGGIEEDMKCIIPRPVYLHPW